MTLTVTGDAGGRWSVVRKDGKWILYVGRAEQPGAEVVIDQDAAWRLFCKGMTRSEAARRTTLVGERALAENALEMVSVIA